MYQEKSIGEVFRHRREDLGVSLKDIESETSIRELFLQAIEEGDIDQLISTAYARGFIKQYANYLGLDGDRIVREHRLIGDANVKSEPLELIALNATKSPRSKVVSYAKVMRSLLGLGIIGVFYLFARYLGIF